VPIEVNEEDLNLFLDAIPEFRDSRHHVCNVYMGRLRADDHVILALSTVLEEVFKRLMIGYVPKMIKDIDGGIRDLSTYIISKNYNLQIINK
jgi:hypothetical protein